MSAAVFAIAAAVLLGQADPPDPPKAEEPKTDQAPPPLPPTDIAPVPIAAPAPATDPSPPPLIPERDSGDSGTSSAQVGPVETSNGLRAERSGLFGWGLGIEIPMVGVLGGIGSISSVGAGYTLGAGVSWEATPAITVRVYGTWGQTRRGNAQVSFGKAGDRIASFQSAEWFDFSLAAGGAYFFRSWHPAFAPYFGADLGITLVHGFEYRFDDSLKDLIADPDQSTQFDNGRLFGRSIGLTGGGRIGVRLDLTEWLATLSEVSVTYVRNGNDRINNTLNGPDVRTVAENVFLVRGTFTVRIGL